MIDILIDTNIYRKDPTQASLPFKALARLSIAKEVRVHIPYIVLREIQTQQVSAYQKEVLTAIGGISVLLKKNLSDEVKKAIADIKDGLDVALPKVISDASNGIVNWANEIGAVLYELAPQDAARAMEAYFNGHAPLKEPKVRKDIPDAFLFQSALTILGEVGSLYVISEDGAFGEAMAQVEHVTLLKTLNDFIEIDEVQAALQKQEESDTIALIIEKLKATGGDEIEIAINSALGEKVMWMKIHANSIPDDNHEATISSFGECEDIELDFDEAAYYGEGQLGMPFTCTMVVSAIYYLFKSDYYMLDVEDSPSVSDHNDHYFEAEEQFEIKITGLISMDINISGYGEEKDVYEFADFDSVEIDDVTEIELIGKG